MTRKTVSGLHAPPPKPTRLFCTILIVGGACVAIFLGTVIDPFLRWALGH
ncbi:MAG: hypothetical protein AAGK71_07670 [Pseudomonadota bacterium]